MKQSVAQVVAAGQIVFLICLLICFGFKPSYLHSEGGFSNYGTLVRTVGFYSLAFLAAAFSSGLAAWRLPAGKVRLAWLMYGLAILFGLVLLSTYPYKLNQFLRNFHELAGAGLFLYEAGLAIWLCLGPARNLLNISLLVIFLSGFGLSFITAIGLAHLLFIGQAVTALAFAALMVNSLRQLLPTKTLLEN